MFSRPAPAALTIRKTFIEHLLLEADGKGAIELAHPC